MSHKLGRVLDLFAGAGGMSLGFRQAGFETYAAVEQDEWACDTLRKNHPSTLVFQRDICAFSDAEIRGLFAAARIDGIVGGPPCQGFSHSNITKRDSRDPRNSLFREFARFIGILKPQFFVMENVPGLLKATLDDGRAAIEVIREVFDDLGYKTHADTLRAELFGVPQIRERLFLIGTRDGTLHQPLPIPSYSMLTQDQSSLFAATGEKEIVTLWEAISDLPALDPGEGSNPSDYVDAPETDYQRELREGAVKLWNHVAMRHSKRVVERFKHIAVGQSQSDVPNEHAPRVRSNGDQISDKRYDQNNRRLDPGKPSHTIPASFYANFVHPFQHRNFTPREGARLQSFPDTYVFSGKPTVVSQKLLAREGRVDEKHLCQYVQIGNAVPPMLARAIASNLERQL
jgi:DNA (cytosine-5)-methyltransferase 1